jgi:hypothetical protein
MLLQIRLKGGVIFSFIVDNKYFTLLYILRFLF